jgi:hypothetical protein
MMSASGDGNDGSAGNAGPGRWNQAQRGQGNLNGNGNGGAVPVASTGTGLHAGGAFRDFGRWGAAQTIRVNPAADPTVTG